MPGRSRGARVCCLWLSVVAGCSSPRVGEGAVGDLRVGGDDARDAGDERHAGDAEHAGDTGASATAPAAPVAGNAVNIDNFAFAPATLTVPAGSTVTWTNHDEEPHTVVANDGSFHSPGMGTQGNVFLHLRQSRHVRLRLLDPPVHARPPWW